MHLMEMSTGNLLVTEDTDDPVLNIAMDQYIAELSYEAVIHFYKWSKPAITIGYFQKSSLFDLNLINKDNIAFIRRITGGNAIYHNDDISFAYIIKKGYKGITKRSDLITFVSNALLRSLNESGTSAKLKGGESDYKKSASCFDTGVPNEIVSMNGDKIAGFALRELRDNFILESSIFADNSNSVIIDRYLIDKNGSILPHIDYSINYDLVKKTLLKDLCGDDIRSVKTISLELPRKFYDLYSSQEWNYRK